MSSVCFQGKPFSITVIQVCAPTTDAKEAEVDQFWEDLKDLLEVTPKKKKNLFYSSLGIWNAKVRNQEIPGVTGKFSLGEQNEAGQRLTEFCQENLSRQIPFFSNIRDDFTHGHHQMVNTKIKLITFFVANGEAVYRQQK